jgi:hypothetical protein
MSGMRQFTGGLALLAGLALSGCSGIADPGHNTNTDFMATIDPGASGAPTGNVHVFHVSRNGEYSAILTALAPTSTTALNVYLGQNVNGLCVQILGQGGIAQLNKEVLRGVINKGDYCIQVFDFGFIPSTQTYTLRVSHP